MKAARLHEPGVLVLDDIPKPTLEPRDLLVQVRAASICGTDLRILRNGHFKLPDGQRRVLGHETAGQVVEIAGEVPGFAVGDRVAVTPNIGCGRCTWCRRGLNNMCPDYEAFGITLDGGFAEYLRVPARAVARGNVFHVPAALAYEEAALVEPFSCCVRGQDVLHVGPDDVVVVIGTGPIGLFHVMLAKLAGARKIIAANQTAPRLQAAKAAGADLVVVSEGTALADTVAEATNGAGADVVITCASSPDVQVEAVELLGTHGRANFFAGLGKAQGVPVDTNKLHYRGITLTGTTGSSNHDYERAMRLAGDRRVSFAGLVSQTFPLEQIHDAFEHSASGLGMKAMVTFDSQATDGEVTS